LIHRRSQRRSSVW